MTLRGFCIWTLHIFAAVHKHQFMYSESILKFVNKIKWFTT